MQESNPRPVPYKGTALPSELIRLTTWCPARDLNPHPFRERVLSPPRLPFHQQGKLVSRDGFEPPTTPFQREHSGQTELTRESLPVFPDCHLAVFHPDAHEVNSCPTGLHSSLELNLPSAFSTPNSGCCFGASCRA